ncbi:hypothetical protein HHK36_024427 [Tetracentron sinense]|uniref:SBP-type domain-containing protein n=1 Tax=Tetracentron sinense TaxID=13715 RepID=A0A834YIY9_TETSI|nr:hypothetical protein HHK36_024427 [Tetracentron sinense]
MESWSYTSDGKGFVLPDEMVSPTDSLARNRKVLTALDLKTPCSYGNNMLASGQQVVENQGFMELGFHDMMRKSLPDNPIGGFWGSEIGSGRVDLATCMVTPNSCFGEEQSSSRVSSSVMDSNSRDSSLIDLKLGTLADYKGTQNTKSFKETLALSSVVSSMPAKRARTTSFNYQTPFCQVHGCNMDLSSSKDYHKRHKVCDIHSKTAKVIVNSIEQRFCQQCSRFHLLAEFDDGKRSCRKRLAGHNERRRKPQLDNHSHRTGKFLSSYHGIKYVCTLILYILGAINLYCYAASGFLETSLPMTPFICSDSGILHPDKYKTGNLCRHIKLEDETSYSTQLAMPITNRHLIHKSFLPTYGMEKMYPPLHANGIDTPKGSIFSENRNWYTNDSEGPNSVSLSLFQNTSSGSEDFTAFNTASAIQGLSRVSDSGCALSLLSSQAHNSSSHSSRIPIAHPLIIQGDHAHYSVGQVPEKILGVRSQASTVLAPYRVSSSGMNSVEVDNPGSILVSDSSDAVDFEVQMDGIFQGPDFVNAKYHFSREHGPTIDLLKLSSQLQKASEAFRARTRKNWTGYPYVEPELDALVAQLDSSGLSVTTILCSEFVSKSLDWTLLGSMGRDDDEGLPLLGDENEVVSNGPRSITRHPSSVEAVIGHNEQGRAGTSSIIEYGNGAKESSDEAMAGVATGSLEVDWSSNRIHVGVVISGASSRPSNGQKHATVDSACVSVNMRQFGDVTTSIGDKGNTTWCCGNDHSGVVTVGSGYWFRSHGFGYWGSNRSNVILSGCSSYVRVNRFMYN